jgi:hypothetical protein
MGCTAERLMATVRGALEIRLAQRRRVHKPFSSQPPASLDEHPAITHHFAVEDTKDF